MGRRLVDHSLVPAHATLATLRKTWSAPAAHQERRDMTRTGRRPAGLLILVTLAAVSVFALAGGAAADELRRRQPMAQNLVEIKVADRAAVEQLMAEPNRVGAEFNDHYLRQNEDDGTVTVSVLGDDDQIAPASSRGYEISARSRTRRPTGTGSPSACGRSRRSRRPIGTPRRHLAGLQPVRSPGRRGGDRDRRDHDQLASTTSRTTPAGSSRSRRSTRPPSSRRAAARPQVRARRSP